MAFTRIKVFCYRREARSLYIASERRKYVSFFSSGVVCNFIVFVKEKFCIVQTLGR